MSAANGSADPGETIMNAKEKGKTAEHPPGHHLDMSMDEDEDTSEEESGVEEPNVEVEEADDDNMEEIDTSNILGRRTRGKAIDYAEAAKKAKDAGDTLDEDDEDEDEDFEEGEQGTADKMEE